MALVFHRRHSRNDPEVYAHNDTDQSVEDRPGSKAISPSYATDVRYFEPFSSSPQMSPRTSTSPRTANDMDAFIQDSEPVPFSSTPDLGSRTTSSSPIAEYDSQVLVTPPEEIFLRTLDRKLQALVDLQNCVGFSSPASLADACCRDEGSQELRSQESAIQDSTPSSLCSVGSQTSLKRKRLEAPTCDTSLENVDDTACENSDAEDDDKATHPIVPVSKKLKETSFKYIATEAASARRARSLSLTSPCESHKSLVPTENSASPSPPSTPVHKAPAVPIIAPPDFEAIPRPPLSLDDVAETRLKALLKREKALRRRGGFEKGINDIFDSSISKDQVDELLGIDEDFRKEVIAWMLQVTPSRKLGVDQLRNQLRTCPETRFHAIALFTRYFMRVGDAMPVASERETPLMKLGRRRIVWDVAMSCLALAVKFNRDFLAPCSPVYARDFLVMAPHPMSHDDFEVSQKDVLEALNYEIRDITPGPFMEEIWSSLPSLRKLLSFSDGWEITQLNAWQILNACATASEMIQFSMSLLTAGAIVEGAVVALMEIYEQDADDPDADRKAREKAEEAIVDYVLDIRELMDIPSVDMKRCRKWLQKIIRTAY